MLAIPTCCTHGCARGCDPRLSSRRRISGTPRCGVASPRRDRRCSLRVIRDCGIRTTHASSPPPVESASSCCLAASTTQASTFRRDGFARTCAATPQLGGHRSRAAGSFFAQIRSVGSAPSPVIQATRSTSRNRTSSRRSLRTRSRRVTVNALVAERRVIPTDLVGGCAASTQQAGAAAVM